MIVDLLQKFIDWLGDATYDVIDALAICPFKDVESYLYQLNQDGILSYVAYFIPIQELLAFMTAWVTCIVVYYGYRFIMNWLNLK